MSSSNSRSGEMAQSGGDAVEKLKQLKRLKEIYFLTLKRHRFLFRDDLVPLVRDWTKQLPNLLDIFTKQEIDWLLTATVNSIEKSQEIIDFFIRCGYKDEPDLDEDGKPILLRTTAVNQIDNASHWDRRVSKSKVLENLFKIYDKFHVNYTDESGCTHFHMACKYGLYDVAEKFLELRQDPNCLVPETGDSMLYFFVTRDLTSYRRDCSKEQIIRLLLKHGADPNLANKNGSTPFHGICQNDSFIADSVFLMLLKCIDEFHLTVQIDAQDSEGNTPLHLATSNGSAEMVESLLTRGADPCLANAKGLTPLHVICRSEHNGGLLRLFFQLNDEIKNTVQLNIQDTESNTPLHLATSCGDSRMVELLLRRGADPCLANAKRQTPLHVICRSDHNEGLLRLFFKLNDELQPMQIDAQDSKGNSPLHLATFNGNARMVELLLRRGADPCSTNAKGLTPLHAICQSDNERSLQLFFEICDEIEKTVQLNIKDKKGNTPLHLATSRGDSQMVELLLRRGADPCLANAKGLLPQHLIDRSEIVGTFFPSTNEERQWMVEIDARDDKGRTALEWAVTRCCPHTVESLLECGADVTGFVFPTPRDSDGYTDINRGRLLEHPRNGGLGCSVIKLAAATGLRAIVELLEERGYELDRDDALKFMGFFDKYGLYESTDFSASEDVDDNLVDSLFEVMEKKPTYMDDYKNASSYKSRKLSRESMEACSLRLCEKISIKFFRDWALDSFMELTHGRLPLLCCDMIIEELKNKDLFIICQAAAGRSS